MFYQIDVTGNLNRDEIEHIHLVDFLLLQELSTNLNTEEINKLSVKELSEDKYYLYLIKTLEAKWVLRVRGLYVPKDPSCYIYRGEAEVTLLDLIYMSNHSEPRHKMIRNLLPIGVSSLDTSYSDMVLESNKRNN